MIFNRNDYDVLHRLVFMPDYPGYRPNVREVPNGDGVVDREKRFAHVATKYLEKDPNASRVRALNQYLHAAHAVALAHARDEGFPLWKFPTLGACALRVLEYPPGAVTAPHTDFDLFTLNCYRDDPGAMQPNCDRVHVGELGEIFGLGPALRHWTEPRAEVTRAIVYFALPSHNTALPGPQGGTVGEWLTERVARSRVAA